VKTSIAEVFFIKNISKEDSKTCHLYYFLVVTLIIEYNKQYIR